MTRYLPTDPSPPTADRASQALRRLAIADAITEEVLQVLYAARQDLSESRDEHGANELLRGAEAKIVSTIAMLRGVAEAVRATADGAPAPDDPADPSRLLVDTLDGAWFVTTGSGRVLYVCDVARDLLNVTDADFRDVPPAEWPWVPRDVVVRHAKQTRRDGRAVSETQLTPSHGRDALPVRISTRRLPQLVDGAPLFITVLTPR